MVSAQGISFSGTVTDTNGTGVPNVQIVISDLMLGVALPVGWSTTDNNGNYNWIDTIGSFQTGSAGTIVIGIIDCNGNSVNQILTFTPNTFLLTANFIYCSNGGGSCSVSAGYVTNPSSIQFAGVPYGGTGPYIYAWDFGDSNTSTVQSPTHVYAQNGQYTACLTATDANGCIATDCQVINVTSNTLCATSFVVNPSLNVANGYSFVPVTTNNLNYIYLWDFGDGSVDSISTPFHTYSQAGTYLISLIQIDLITGCIATASDTLVVGGGSPYQVFISYNNTPGSLTVDFFSSSSPVNSVVYPTWDFGDGSTSNSPNPTHTYNTTATGPVSYNVTLSATNGMNVFATATETVIVYPGSPSGQIGGYLWKDTTNFTSADGLVYLIEYDSTNGGILTAIDTVQTQQGFFDFQNVPMGLYLVKAALLPTDSDYANYLPTYFIQSLSWGNAQYVGPAPSNLLAFIDIQLIAGNNPGGAGFIGGLVVNGAGRPVTGDVTLVEDITNLEPMEGVSVLLLDANNNAVTHAVTATDGSYSFSNIAMGTYNVHVEEVGKVTFDATVTIDAANMSHAGVHFTIHENMVTLTGVYDVANVESFQVFPNPVTNIANVQIQLNESMDATLTVTNLMGQTMINQNRRLNAGDNTFGVEMNDLPSGLYLLSVKSGSDIITYKIQKQ